LKRPLVESITKAYAKNENNCQTFETTKLGGKKKKKKPMILKELCLSNSILYYKTYKETH
jgi:hypothetical protein